MAGADQTRFEQLVGLDTSRQSLVALKSLYSASHQDAEARSIEGQLVELSIRRSSQLGWDRQTYAALFASFRRSAIVVQSCVALLLFCVLATVSSIVFLEISALLKRPGSKFALRLACFSLDYAPVLLPLASFALLLSFRPFADAFAKFRSAGGPLADSRFFGGAYFALQAVLPRLPFDYRDAGGYYRWCAATALAGTAFLIAWRGLSRKKALVRQK